MANEAVCIEKPTIYRRYTISGATTIAKNTLMQITTDNRVIASDANAAGQVWGGITTEGYTGVAGAADTEITCALDGVYDLLCANAGVTLGALVVLSGANAIRNSAEADFPLGRVLGKAMETGTAAEVIKVRLGVV